METGRLQPSHWSQGNVDTNFCKPPQIKELYSYTSRVYFTSLYVPFTLSHTSTVIRMESWKVYALAKYKAYIWWYATIISPSNQLEENSSYCLSGQGTVLFTMFNKICSQQAFWRDHCWKSQVVTQCCAHQGKELEQLSPPGVSPEWLMGITSQPHG